VEKKVGARNSARMGLRSQTPAGSDAENGSGAEVSSTCRSWLNDENRGSGPVRLATHCTGRGDSYSEWKAQGTSLGSGATQMRH
jgi:hypothetical protein